MDLNDIEEVLDEVPASPESVRLEVAKRLYRKAISTYEMLLQSKDPKILKDVAKDILEITAGKQRDASGTGGTNLNIALFPPEYIAKVASSMKNFQNASIVDSDFKEMRNVTEKRASQRKARIQLPQQFPEDDKGDLD